MPINITRLALVWAVAPMLGFSGCAPQPMCQRALTASWVRAEHSFQTIEPDFWAALLLADAAHDCRGVAIGAPAADEAPAATATTGTSRQAPRWSAADVVLSAPLQQDPSLRLVWLKAQRSKGFVTGPLALVAVGSRRIEVRAIGLLRLPGEDVSLSWVDMHEFAAARIDMRRCTAQMGKAPLCCQSMRIMPSHQGKLWAGLDEDDDVELACVHELRSQKRLWARRVAHHAQVELCEGVIILTESAALTEHHLQRASMSPRLVRQAEAVRAIRWENRMWKSSDLPLWQMMAQSEIPRQR